ncbi:NAC domain-containing protein 83-like [Syzygium oleosum]|uniref:NAC domain-containing protein 83-like n=1 Tax=Syzygium oleosum TaxID=219896 RepID=UPI0011D1A2AC|nr:NAC domain-containing protein 83-like [Syzygium oleosum]
MCPPAAAALDESWTREEFFRYMKYMAEGRSVPADVITDVNPFNRLPETLPGENKWYYITSMENRGAEGGFWKPRGQPREIYGDASITGWEATHEFYEGQGPHVEKTNWLMLEYYTTPNVSREAVPARDANSLCLVFRSCNSPLSDSENYVYSLRPCNFNIPTGQRVTNQMQVDTGSCNIMQRVTSILPIQPVENPAELDHTDSGGYLELLDLLFTPSPSSGGSDNSSCMTMLSDECFDYPDAMLDLEAESGDHVEHKDAGCNLSVSDSSKPDDIVVQAAISGLPIEERYSENARDAGKAVNRDSSRPLTSDSQSSEPLNNSQTPSADGRNKTDGRLKKLKRKYLSTSSSQSSDGSNSGQAPSPSPGGRTKTDGTLKKLQKKYLCFMPF